MTPGDLVQEVIICGPPESNVVHNKVPLALIKDSVTKGGTLDIDSRSILCVNALHESACRIVVIE